METEKRTSAKSTFAGIEFSGLRKIQKYLFTFVVFICMSLPLFTTFNEVLTRVFEKTGAYVFLSEHIVPFETRAVAVVLKPLGIEGMPTTSHIYITNDNKNTAIFFSWNCLGWQSVILLILTLIIGLSGGYSMSGKIQTLLLGISGTFLINIVRISVVVIIAYYFGQLPAVIVHDYGGTLFTIIWFFFYWWFSYSYILEDKTNAIQENDADG